MFRSTLVAGVALSFFGFTSPLMAQVAPYNPYAASQEEVLPAVAADGTLHWPVFFKSAKMELSYQRLWNLGACRGTNMRITGPVEQNKISIDKMPEGTVEGVVTLVSTGAVMLKQSDGKLTRLVTHPEGVSRVSVTGDVPANMLKPGMQVRLVASVDEHGVGAEPIDVLDVISVDKDFTPLEVKAGAIQTITAKVVSLRGQRLQLLVGTGSLRKLTFQLDEAAIAHVMTRDIGYASIGDTLTAKGHMYSGTATEHWVFASDVTVVKEAKGTQAAAPAPKKIALKPLK
jgi:hypothetical protein